MVTMRRAFVAAALVGAALLAPLQKAAAATDGPAPLNISGVDASAYPTVTMEVSVPGAVAGDTDLAPTLRVVENGRPVTANVEQLSAEGLEVVMLFDVSGSMKQGGALAAAKSAALGFLDALPAQVSVGVVSFGNSTHVESPLSLDRALLANVIKNLTARGETSLYDAVVLAQTLFSGNTSDKQLVLLSDGGDTVSSNDLAQATAVAAAIKTNVIELTSTDSNHAALEQLSSAGGGTIGSANDPAALQGLYKRVANAIINRYRVSFQSNGHGAVNYTVTVETAAGPAAANVKATLPSLPPAPVPTTTTIAPAPPTTTATTAVVAAAPEAPSDTVAVAAAPASGSSSSDGQTLRLLLGTTAEFIGLSVLTLLAVPFTKGRNVPLNRLVVAHKESVARGESFRTRVTRAAERMLERRGRRRGLAEALDVAGISLRPGEFFVLAITAGAVLALVFFALFGVFGMVLGTIAAPLLARAYVSSKANARRRAFGEQLPDLMQSMVSSLRGGYGLPQAIDSAANQAAEPARTELQRVLLEGRIGRDPTEALQAVADRMQSRDFKWVVAAIDINRDIGGELALVLENVAETVRERQRLSRQVRTLTAEGRLSAYVLTGLPILLALFFQLTNPNYFDPLRKAPGPALIVLAGLLMVIGWAWMRKLVKSVS